jgi:hypothetical protein
MKHTKGNWRTSKKFDEITVSKPGILEGSKSIAMVSDFSKSKEEVKANAILMAAAPELFEALKEAYNYLRPISNQWEGRETMGGQMMLASMRSAIQKAES